MKALLRRALSPLVRWLSRGGRWGFEVGRSETGVYLIVNDCWGDDYWIKYTPAEAREVAGRFFRMARDVQEGVPLGEEG